MRRSDQLWAYLLLTTTLLLLESAAKRSSSIRSVSRAKAIQTRRRRAYEDDDDNDDWSGRGTSKGVGGTSSEGWGSFDEDEEPAAAAFIEESDDFDSTGSRGDSYSREHDQGEFWSEADGDVYDDDDDDAAGEQDSWDDDYDVDAPVAPSSRSSRNGRAAGGAPERLRPSAWTGDGGSAGRWRRSSRSTGSSALGRYQSGRRQPAPARGFAVRMPVVSGAAFASTLRRQMGTAREALGQAGSLAASTSKRLKREVKLVVSGSWESALLKVTWPDDSPPDEALVLSMVDAVHTFKKDRDVTKNSAEHRVLLRKLWAKMSEPDWRTVSKAVYLFHSILRDLPAEHHSIIKIFLGKMSREWDKKTGCRYFDLDVLCAVNEEGEAFRSFVDRYGTYVFKRAEGFNARFQELDSMRDEEGGWETVVTTLAKAQKAIDLGLACQPAPEEETELTVLCLRNTVMDTHQLWRRFHSALIWVLAEADGGDLFDGVDSAVVGECLDEFKDFYTSRHDEVVSFLLDAEELLGIYGLQVPDLRLPAAHAFDTTSSRSTPPNDIGSPAGLDGSSSSSSGGSSKGGDSSDVKVEGGVSKAMSEAATERAGVTGKRANNGAGRGKAAGAGQQRNQPPPSPPPWEAPGVVPVDVAGVGGTCEAGGEEGKKRPGVAEEEEDEDDEDEDDEDEDEDDEDEDEDDEDDEDEEASDSGGGEEDSSSEDAAGDEGDSDDADSGEEASSEGGGGNEDEGGEEDEEDSAEEGAVDEHVDDLTYFDDATQPERSSDHEWDRY